MIHFVLADLKYKNLGTPIFEKFDQNLNIRDFTINFKQFFNDQPATVCFTTVIETNFFFIF